ncbi:hypothetical protein OS493_040678, partial [Desmophyllum pertusum]
FQEVKYYLASAPVKNVVEGTEKLDSVSPPFIYLTQTEQCLPSKLVQNLQLNVSSECQCEVIVLSYETESQEESRLISRICLTTQPLGDQVEISSSSMQ